MAQLNKFYNMRNLNIFRNFAFTKFCKFSTDPVVKTAVCLTSTNFTNLENLLEHNVIAQAKRQEYISACELIERMKKTKETYDLLSVYEKSLFDAYFGTLSSNNKNKL